MNRNGCADCALQVLNEVLNGEGEWTVPYVLAGVIASNLAIATAIDRLSQTIIDKFPDPSPYQAN